MSDAIDLRPTPGALQSAEDAVIELQAYFARSAATRRRKPTTDLLATLVAQVHADQGVTEDEIEGRALQAGQRALIVIGAANRDPAVFADPDRLDISRSPNPHLSFGMGSHYCAGAPLARMQAGIAINALINRLPRLRVIAETPAWRANASLRGLLRLPCRF